MPVSSRFRLCEFISTTNRKCHKLFAVFLVNIWIVQSCYFVHCLHLPRCLYYTQCHHSMSSFSPLPYLHYLLHHLHRCIIFLLIFPTVLAFIIIVLTSITAINAIAKVFSSMFFIFITVSFFSSSVFLLLFFILMGVVLIVTGLDIGYVPAGPRAFFRLSGQFGPQQFIFCWPAGPVTFISVVNTFTTFSVDLSRARGFLKRNLRAVS